MSSSRPGSDWRGIAVDREDLRPCVRRGMKKVRQQDTSMCFVVHPRKDHGLSNDPYPVANERRVGLR
jgi:hypothetical protein